MPKIIKDLKPTAVRSAVDIFQAEGFEAVDMRRVAKACGIAVGTLYNYFPNKHALMREIFSVLWHESLGELNTLVDNHPNGETLMVDFAHALVAERTKKQGIGRKIMAYEFINTDTLEQHPKHLFGDEKIHRVFTQLMRKTLQKAYGIPDDAFEEPDMSRMIMTSIFLLMSSERNDEPYILFAEKLIRSYMNAYVKG